MPPGFAQGEGDMRGHLGFDKPWSHGIDADTARLEQWRPGLAKPISPALLAA
jgi:hypothetical protein